MNDQTAQYKATEHIFDLNNAASENGFKTGECWEVNVSTATEKNAIEKQYHPTVASLMPPEILDAAFRLVKESLKQPIKEKSMVASRFSPVAEHQYLVAYNPDRLRR